MAFGSCSKKILPTTTMYQQVRATNGPLYSDATNSIVIPVAAIIILGGLLFYGCWCALTNPKRD